MITKRGLISNDERTKKLGEDLKKIRKALNLNQDEFIWGADINRVTYAKLEREGKIQVKYLKRLKSILKLNIKKIDEFKEILNKTTPSNRNRNLKKSISHLQNLKDLLSEYNIWNQLTDIINSTERR